MKTPKPFFRKQTASYYVRMSNGKFHPLGKDEKEAFKKYYALMADRQPTTPDTKVSDLSARFLKWCKAEREPLTVRFYGWHLESFLASIGPKLAVAQLKPFHITEWLAGSYPGRSANYRNGAVRSVKRLFQWCLDEGHIEKNPVARVKAPSPENRVVYISDAEWERIIGSVDPADPFFDLLWILRETGCRVREARIVCGKWFNRDTGCWVFPVKQSKGKKRERVVPLSNRALEITRRLVMKHGDEELFRNTDGKPWTRFAINCRFARLRKNLGIKTLCATALRHTFISNSLKRHVEPTVLAHIVGHRDCQMIFATYGHTNLIAGHVRDALAVCVGEDAPAKPAKLA